MADGLCYATAMGILPGYPDEVAKLRSMWGSLMISCLAGCVSDMVAASSETGGETGSEAGGGHQACDSDRWEPAASPLVARQRHAAVLLGDGRVLVTGGFGLDLDDTLASGEVWDPVSDEWTAIADMPTARRNHSLVVVDDGTVLAIGGSDSPTRVDHWDPSVDAWSEAGALPIEPGVAIAAPEGGVLVVGSAELVRSDDLGESWAAVEAPPRRISAQYAFRWDVDIIVFPVLPIDGDDLMHPVLFYDWSEGVWLDGPTLELDPFLGFGDRNAWGPLSDSKLAVVASRPGNDPDPLPPPASLTHELQVDSPWDIGTNEGPWFGNSSATFPAEPFWPGCLWVNQWIYDDETNAWCRAADPESSLRNLETVVLPDGRIFFTGRLDDVEPPTSVALSWSP